MKFRLNDNLSRELTIKFLELKSYCKKVAHSHGAMQCWRCNYMACEFILSANHSYSDLISDL